MVRGRHIGSIAIAGWILCAALASQGAELVRLSAENWSEYAPVGKEVDAIYGDYAIRNDRLVAVIAAPVPGRSANWYSTGAGGFLIDMTRRDAPSDQLRHDPRAPGGGAHAAGADRIGVGQAGGSQL